jgi:hypothetical protein
VNIDALLDNVTRTLDNTLREVEGKATIRELSEQAERFAYYTPIYTTETLQVEVATKASKGAIEAVDSKVDEVRTSLEGYIPVSKEAEIKAEITSKIKRRLKAYCTNLDLNGFKTEVNSSFADVRSFAEDNFGYAQERDKLIKSDIDVLRDLLQRKPWTADLKPILKEIKKKAAKTELETLRNDAMPRIANSFAKLAELRGELDRFDCALGRFDEIICDKASKGDILDVKRTIKGFLAETKFTSKVLEFEGLFKQMDLKSQELQEELPKLHLAIEAVHGQVSSQKQEARDYKQIVTALNELRDRLDSKADLSDLVKLAERSALWSDGEVLKQKTELLKRQVESTSVLSAYLARTLLKDIDTPVVKYRRRAEVYRLLLSMIDWVRTGKSSVIPEDLSDFDIQPDQSLKNSPRTIKSQTQGLNFELMKPKTSTRRRASAASSPREKHDLPPLKIYSAMP